jgi:hypothetical protein
MGERQMLPVQTKRMEATFERVYTGTSGPPEEVRGCGGGLCGGSGTEQPRLDFTAG